MTMTTHDDQPQHLLDAIEGFVSDPPYTEFQRGYLAALLVVYRENLNGSDITDPMVRAAQDLSRKLTWENFDPVADIDEFHEEFDIAYRGPPRFLPEDLDAFRIGFMAEELDEYVNHTLLQDKLDALVDLVYVALGTAHLHGFDFREAWRRVHEANMRKVRTPSASDSKRGSSYDVVKPPGWTPPDLSDLVSG